MEGLIPGRIVHYSPGKNAAPFVDQHRAAVVTHVWWSSSEEGVVNLYVFPDGMNEHGQVYPSVAYSDQLPEHGNPSWHWPTGEG